MIFTPQDLGFGEKRLLCAIVASEKHLLSRRGLRVSRTGLQDYCGPKIGENPLTDYYTPLHEKGLIKEESGEVSLTQSGRKLLFEALNRPIVIGYNDDEVRALLSAIDALETSGSDIQRKVLESEAWRQLRAAPLLDWFKPHRTWLNKPDGFYTKLYESLKNVMAFKTRMEKELATQQDTSGQVDMAGGWTAKARPNRQVHEI